MSLRECCRQEKLLCVLLWDGKPASKGIFLKTPSPINLTAGLEIQQAASCSKVGHKREPGAARALGCRCESGPACGAPTWIVGLSLQRLQLGALGQGVLQAELQEAGLRPAHPLQQGQQGHRLLALVPALEPAG